MTDFQTYIHRALWLTLALFVAGGCAGGGRQRGNSAATQAVLLDDRSPAAIQSDVMDFADSYSNTIENAYSAIARNPGTTSEMRRLALSIALDNSRGAFINATEENPLRGLVNMAVLVSLQRQSCDEEWFGNIFGPDAQPTRAALAVQEEQVWTLAARYLTTVQIQELQRVIAEWRATHPDERIITLVRLQDFQQAHPQAARSNAQGPNSVFSLLFLDPFGSLDPAVREFQETRVAAARMFYYVQRMPDLLRMQAEELFLDVLASPQIASVVDSAANFNAATATFNATCKQFADTVATFPADLAAEREKAIAQMNEVIAAQRDAAIKQFADAVAKERDATIVQLDATVQAQSKALIDQAAKAISAERELSIREAAAAVDLSRRAALADLDTVGTSFSDRFSLRLFIAVVASALVVALIALVYRWGAARLGGDGPRSDG